MCSDREVHISAVLSSCISVPGNGTGASRIGEAVGLSAGTAGVEPRPRARAVALRDIALGQIAPPADFPSSQFPLIDFYPASPTRAAKGPSGCHSPRKSRGWMLRETDAAAGKTRSVRRVEASHVAAGCSLSRRCVELSRPPPPRAPPSQDQRIHPRISVYWHNKGEIDETVFLGGHDLRRAGHVGAGCGYIPAL